MNALVYLSAIFFLLAVFPVHVLTYVYISTEEKYASVNITLYRLITVKNFNTDDIDFNALLSGGGSDNGGKKKKFLSTVNWLTLFNNLCLTKVVQLGDYGMQSTGSAYAALANGAITGAAYTFIELNGGKTKLRNYPVLNYEHGGVNYYLKIGGVINVITLVKLFTIFIWGKINET